MPVASFHLKTYEACQNAHAIAVLTEWDEFATHDWQKIYDLMQNQLLFFDAGEMAQHYKKLVLFIKQLVHKSSYEIFRKTDFVLPIL
jgi:hypothetical protein